MSTPKSAPSSTGAVSWAIAAVVFALLAVVLFARSDTWYLLAAACLALLMAVVLAARSILLIRRGDPTDKGS